MRRIQASRFPPIPTPIGHRSGPNRPTALTHPASIPPFASCPLRHLPMAQRVLPCLGSSTILDGFDAYILRARCYNLKEVLLDHGIFARRKVDSLSAFSWVEQAIGANAAPILPFWSLMRCIRGGSVRVRFEQPNSPLILIGPNSSI